ncbi:ubiquinone/menaquinone biosynthesis methyltransferase ubie [Pseudomonas aeruginosa]|nr:ubiquinone/menaquinone biosynthesis methyltransferase ubie [Pseudomonas aeruginosa]
MSTEDFDAITATTLADYQRNAEGFREGTRGHDVSQNVEALLRHIDGPPPYRILDFGCGPGATWPPSAASATSRWDSKARRASSRWPGPTAVARYGNRISWRCDCRLGTSTASSPTPACSMCPAAPCRGCSANSSKRLRPGGVLFSSNPRGDNREGWNGQRYGAYHDYPAWKRLLEEAGFVELEHYYRPPGLPREQQPWLASVWRRPV